MGEVREREGLRAPQDPRREGGAPSPQVARREAHGPLEGAVGVRGHSSRGTQLGFFWNVRRVSPSLNRGLGLRIPPMCTGETRGPVTTPPMMMVIAMLYLRCWKFTSQQRTSSPGRG